MFGSHLSAQSAVDMKGFEFMDERRRQDLAKCRDVRGVHMLPLVFARGDLCDDNSITREDDRVDTFHKNLGSSRIDISLSDSDDVVDSEM